LVAMLSAETGRIEGYEWRVKAKANRWNQVPMFDGMIARSEVHVKVHVVKDLVRIA